MFSPFLSYLDQLHLNNNRTWFHENKSLYDDLRKELIKITMQLIDFLKPLYHLGELDPKKCIFRINRDIRFSKDKSPYKTNFGIDVLPGGRRSGFPSFYLHIQPGNYSFVGGGLYMPDRYITHAIREAINTDGKTLQLLFDSLSDGGFHRLEEHKLKTMPRGYPKDHPYRDLLRLKDWVVHRPLSDQELASDNSLNMIMSLFGEMVEFNTWLLQYTKNVS